MRCLFPALPRILLATTVLLSGCSGGQEAQRTGSQGQQTARQFSQEEQRAARALSVGNSGVMQEAASPYDQAVLCSAAIEALAERLRGSDALTSEQMRIVEQAKAVYDRRGRILAEQARAAQGNRGAGTSGPLQPDAGYDPPGGQALQAIGCIQRLADAG